jgi:hypothetical protein
MKRPFHSFLLGALVVSTFLTACGGSGSDLGSGTPTPTMKVLFVNSRSDAAQYTAYATFGGGGTLTATKVSDGSTIAKGTSYSFSELSQGVYISEYDSGRIFISIGSTLTTPNSGNGFAANYNNPNLADFATRWDKVELTYSVDPVLNTGAGGADLTSADFFGMPLDIVTTGGTVAPTHLTWRANTVDVFEKLGMLSNFKPITIQDATGSVGVGNNGVMVQGVNNGKVVRIVNPSSVSPVNGGTPFPSFQSYITYLKTGNTTNPGTPIVTNIVGANGQITKGGPFQTYTLQGTISNSTYTLAGMTINPGDVVLDGTVNNGDGNGDVVFTMRFAAADFTDYTIYGAAVPFSILRGSDVNEIAEKVRGDYLSALNFGLAGSTVDNPNLQGTPIGNSPSWTWYGNQPSGQPFAKLPITNAFAYAQPGMNNMSNFNQFAGYLVGVTDSYGFAFNDRLEAPLAAVTDGSTVTVTILPDTR